MVLPLSFIILCWVCCLLVNKLFVRHVIPGQGLHTDEQVSFPFDAFLARRRKFFKSFPWTTSSHASSTFTLVFPPFLSLSFLTMFKVHRVFSRCYFFQFPSLFLFSSLIDFEFSSNGLRTKFESFSFTLNLIFDRDFLFWIRNNIDPRKKWKSV